MTVSDAGAGQGPGPAPRRGKSAGNSGRQPAADEAAEPAPGEAASPAAGGPAQPATDEPTTGEAASPAAGGPAQPTADEPTTGEAAGPAVAETAKPAASAGAATGAGADELTGDEQAELEHLRADERAELEDLRAEVAELRNRPPAPAPTRRRRGGWRAPVATLLIILGCVLAPLSVMGVWTANQVSNTDRYIANIEPLIHDPAIQAAMTDKITIEIDHYLNVKGLATSAASALTSRGLPRVGQLLNTFSGSLASAVSGFIHTQVAKIVASPQVANLWLQVNRTVHAQLVKALSGQGGSAISISNGQVVLSLGPFINIVKRDLANRGLTIVNRIPAINPTLALFSAKYLVKAQTGYRLLNDLKIVLPILTLVLLGLGVYIARGHRRALIGAGIGLAASMLVLGLALAIFRGIYLNSVPDSVLPANAAAVLYDTLVRFIKDGLRVLLVVGLIVAAAAFFTGPSVTAVRTRGGFESGFAWLRASGEHAGLRTGPVGRWTYTHRKALRITAVIIAGLVFIFWGQPTWQVALVIAIILLVVIGLIELLGQPPAQPQAAG
jgi:hypothetical protein